MKTATTLHARTPKYVKIAEHLRAQIQSGALQPHERVPSFPQLRSTFGVSQNTVEKAHALLEDDGLIIREQGRGTFVADGSVRPGTSIIGCYGLSWEYRHLPYYHHLMKGIQSAARQANYEILLLHEDTPSIGWEKLDAVLFVDAEADEKRHRLPPGMRCVSLLHQTQEMPSVVTDDYQGMFEATEYLLSLGHRRIAYLHEFDPLTDRRVSGYRDALRAAGVEPQKNWQREMVHYHREEEFRGRGRESMQLWLQDGWREEGITALLCQNDRTAIGVLDALREADIKVPEELSVVGFDSTDECELCHPRLTSVKVPLEEIGARGMEILLSEMEQENGAQPVDETLTLPTCIDVRGSVASR